MKIELIHVSFAYTCGSYIIKDLSLVFQEGESVAIIGQNGSGKTTLVKQLNGILKPSSGNILFDGESVLSYSIARLSGKVGYVFQNPDDQLFLSTVRKELNFGPLQLGYSSEECKKNVEEAAEICGITEYLDCHPLDLGASRKKICAIASVLSMQTEVVVLDEPTMGQDREGIRRLAAIISNLKERGKICIAISHDMKFVADNFDRVIVLKSGEILADAAPGEVFSKPDILRQSYISPPPITRVCQCCGIGESVFTMEEFNKRLGSDREERVHG